MKDEDQREKLTDEEFAEYKQAIAEDGEPGTIKGTLKPNKSLQLMWNFREKYHFDLRWVTEITEDGFIQYKLRRN